MSQPRRNAQRTRPRLDAPTRPTLIALPSLRDPIWRLGHDTVREIVEWLDAVQAKA